MLLFSSLDVISTIKEVLIVDQEIANERKQERSVKRATDINQEALNQLTHREIGPQMMSSALMGINHTLQLFNYFQWL